MAYIYPSNFFYNNSSAPLEIRHEYNEEMDLSNFIINEVIQIAERVRDYAAEGYQYPYLGMPTKPNSRNHVDHAFSLMQEESSVEEENSISPVEKCNSIFCQVCGCPNSGRPKTGEWAWGPGGGKLCRKHYNKYTTLSKKDPQLGHDKYGPRLKTAEAAAQEWQRREAIAEKKGAAKKRQYCQMCGVEKTAVWHIGPGPGYGKMCHTDYGYFLKLRRTNPVKAKNDYQPTIHSLSEARKTRQAKAASKINQFCGICGTFEHGRNKTKGWIKGPGGGKLCHKDYNKYISLRKKDPEKAEKDFQPKYNTSEEAKAAQGINLYNDLDRLELSTDTYIH